MKKTLSLLLSVSALVSLAASAAIAQQRPATTPVRPATTPPSPAATEDAQEEALDDAIVRFGYTSGAAYQCSASSAAVDIEQTSLRAYTGISRLFGSDRAFFYAASYGSGASAQLDRARCPQFIQQFQEAIQNSRLSQGE